jgi:uncharacterized protein (DUF1015 family)
MSLPRPRPSACDDDAVTDVRPFTALRPLPQLAHKVAAPPYDVVEADEARAIIESAPDSFLRVTRPDADPSSAAAGQDEQHERGAFALHELVRRGVLVREAQPAFWVYRQQVRSRVQTGIVGLASVADYDSGVIRVHEHTRPDKEDERARHIDVLDAHDEPVVLFHRGSDELDAVVTEVAAGEHDLAVTTPDGIWHTLWRVTEPDAVARIAKAFAGLDRLYVADGHHRSAAAARLAATRRELGAEEAGAVGGFLAVIFPADELTVLPYHRVVMETGGDLLDRLHDVGDLEPVDEAFVPEDRSSVGVGGVVGWYRLSYRGDLPAEGSVQGLAVSLLQERVLAPLLGVEDPRRDPRLAFVGGPDGLAELDTRIHDGRCEIAFALPATALADLVAVSDRGEIMPPKSTWFWPKPASGLLVHPLH